MTLSQFFGCFIIPAIRQTFKLRPPKTLKLYSTYLFLTILVFCATGLATASLNYVNYPVKVIFKSAKLIPTMLVSTVMHKKVYQWRDYSAALLLIFGTVCYAYDFNKTDSSENKWGGIVMLTISIACDAIVPNFQQYLMVEEEISADEVMINTNFMGLILILAYLSFSGDIQQILHGSVPVVFFLHVLSIGLCLGCAVTCYTQIIKQSGSVIAVTVATVRKIATILLSYIVFPKHIAVAHIIGASAVIAGIVLESWK